MVYVHLKILPPPLPVLPPRGAAVDRPALRVIILGDIVYTRENIVIMEYLVNISKRRAFWSLNRDILKITILNTNMTYPLRKIRRIRACTHQRPQRKQVQYAVNLDNLTNNVLILLDSWTSGLLEYKLPLSRTIFKELRTNTFSGSDHEDANEHIEKVLEIVDLFHIPNKYCPHARTAKKMEEINNFQQEPDENLYQAWERFKELLMKCPQHYLTEMQEPFKKWACNYSQKWHNGTTRSRSTETFDGLASIQAQLNNLGREIKKVNEKVYVAQVGCKQCKGPHYTKDCPLKEEQKNPRRSLLHAIWIYMPEDIKVPLILRRPFLSTARAKIDVYKRKITLRVGEERIVFTSVKPASSLIKRVYMLSLRERMELDLEAWLREIRDFGVTVIEDILELGLMELDISIDDLP
ncbi:hypothetical protein Tco_0390500 [Tanacetum coccineum]